MKLFEELRLALERIKESWESSQALSVFISIVSRLLSVTSSSIVQDTCVTFLQDARAVALDWIMDLRVRTQRVEAHNRRTEYISKCAEIVLICIDSFNVEDSHLRSVSAAAAQQARILLQCAIIAQESRSILSISLSPTIKLLLLRSQRLLYRCYGMLSSYAALDDVIASS